MIFNANLFNFVHIPYFTVCSIHESSSKLTVELEKIETRLCKTHRESDILGDKPRRRGEGWVLAMQTLGSTPRLITLLNGSSLHLNLRAFSSSSASGYGNQSRGGLPRFFSETLPPSKAHSSLILFMYILICIHLSNLYFKRSS